jgi:phage baseplate assembly protein W
MSYTVKFPLNFDGPGKGFDMLEPYEIITIINFNLKNILLTMPGERIWIPEFGVGLQNYLFEQGDLSVLSEELKSKIVFQIEEYQPLVNVLGIDVSFPEDNVMHVLLNWNSPDLGISAQRADFIVNDT